MVHFSIVCSPCTKKTRQSCANRQYSLCSESPYFFLSPSVKITIFRDFSRKKGQEPDSRCFPPLLFRYGFCVPVQEKVADQRASSWIFWVAISARQAIWISQKLPPPSFTVT